MALIRSSTISSISGSIGGTTYARNRGGAYARNRTVPINPNSTSQSRARSSLTLFSGGWSSVLTSTQRSAWAGYAESQNVLNRLGETVTLTGQQAYVRSNTLLLLAGLAAVVVPPEITPPQLAIASGEVALLDVSANTVTIDLSAGVTGSVLAFCGPAQAAGALSVKVPFRYYGKMDADADFEIVAAASVASRIFTVGQSMAWRFVAITATGARSNDLILRGVAIA